ncbi:MAG: TIGR04282 family arsenosugar biosynthesis glycosyltransferase [Acidimicrobiia bacterium]
MTTIAVMAKEPRPGRCKTRLCPPATPAEAALLAEAALADTLAAVSATTVDRRVLVLDGRPGPWLPPGFTVIPQGAGGLDARLAVALTDVGGARAGEPTLVIGMDTPQVTASLLDTALHRLEDPDVDAVLGPAADGGWWALGLRRPDPAATLGVPMSTPYTGAAQRRRLEALGLRVADLVELRDVDVMEDARAVAAQVPGSRFARTLAHLAPTTAGMSR